MHKDEFFIREVKLKKIKLGLTLAASDYMLDAEAQYIVDSLQREVRFHLRGFLLGEKIETIQYPDGWWQAFKLEVLPLWLRLFFPPVKYRRRVINAVYPDFKPALPKERYIVTLIDE